MKKTKQTNPSKSKKIPSKKVKVEVRAEAEYSYEFVIGVVDKEEAEKIGQLETGFYFHSEDEDEGGNWKDYGNLYEGVGFLSARDLEAEITINGETEDTKPENKEIWFGKLSSYRKKPKKGETILIAGLPLKSASATIEFEVELKKDEEFEPNCLMWVMIQFPEEFCLGYYLDIGDYEEFDDGLIVGMAYIRDANKELKEADIHYFQDWDDSGNNGYYLLQPCLTKYKMGY